MIAKFALAIFVTVFSLKSYAITYEIIGPCAKKPVYSGEILINNLNISVGKNSLSIFENENIPYLGSEDGFKSILKTPTGEDSIEVISETKMRAYGWCFSVNGLIPDSMPNEIFYSSNNDKLVWFYAFSTYDNGVWLDYCVPSYTIKAPQFCK